MRKRINKLFFEEAIVDALSGIYKLTKENSSLYYGLFTIVREMRRNEIYGSVESYEVPKIMQPFVEEGLVHEVRISNDPNPKYDSDLRIGYQANLNRENEILERISPQ